MYEIIIYLECFVLQHFVTVSVTVTEAWHFQKCSKDDMMTGRKCFTMFNKVLWSDKSGFHIGGFVNRHICHDLAGAKPHIGIEHSRKRAGAFKYDSVMWFWCHPYFLISFSEENEFRNTSGNVTRSCLTSNFSEKQQYIASIYSGCCIRSFWKLCS